MTQKPTADYLEFVWWRKSKRGFIEGYAKGTGKCFNIELKNITEYEFKFIYHLFNDKGILLTEYGDSKIRENDWNGVSYHYENW